MAWEISKIGEDVLKLDDLTGNPCYLSWQNITTDVNGNFVKFSQDGVVHNGKNEIKIIFSDVANITSVSAVDLMEKVIDLFQSISTATINSSIETTQTALNTQKIEASLNDLIEELKITNKYLRKIYNPE